jgi:hypothetical protein
MEAIVNTMIFKDTGIYRIHHLRVIHIYEADFNLFLAVKWRETLCITDRNGLINNRQFGHEATLLALLEELWINISYLTRRTLITFDNDAASCYDQIIAAFASRINQKFGLHRQLAVIHGKTLEEARYKLRTAIGISESDYSHSTQFPLYGSSQGSSNLPALWLFISATLFDVHKRFAYGATFTDPSGEVSVQLKLSGFVDDTKERFTQRLAAPTTSRVRDPCRHGTTYYLCPVENPNSPNALSTSWNSTPVPTEPRNLLSSSQPRWPFTIRKPMRTSPSQASAPINPTKH